MTDDCKRRKELEKITLRQADTIQKLEREIRERCHSYLLQITALKASSQRQIRSEKTIERELTPLANQRPMPHKLGIVRCVDVSVHMAQKEEAEDYRFNLEVIKSLKDIIAQQQKSKNEITMKSERLQSECRNLRRERQILLNQNERHKKDIANRDQSIGSLRAYEDAFRLLREKMGDSVTSLLNPVQLIQEVLERKEESVGRSGGKMSVSLEGDFGGTPDQFLRKTRLDKSQIVGTCETLPDRWDYKARSQLFKSQEVKPFDRICELDLPYYVEEDLQVPDSDYVKRCFLRKKIVKRSVSVTAYRTESKDKKEIRQILKKSHGPTELKENEDLSHSRRDFKVPPADKYLMDNQRVSEMSRQSQLSELSLASNGEEIRLLDIFADHGQSQVHSTLIYNIKS